jgi:hypothetical protein
MPSAIDNRFIPRKSWAVNNISQTLGKSCSHRVPTMTEQGPLMLLAVALFIGGIQFISMGLLSEIVARTYYESRNKPIYVLGEVKSHGKRVGDFADSLRSLKNPQG